MSLLGGLQLDPFKKSSSHWKDKSCKPPGGKPDAGLVLGPETQEVPSVLEQEAESGQCGGLCVPCCAVEVCVHM